MLYGTAPFRAVSCFIVLYYVVLCHVLCYVVLCCVVLCCDNAEVIAKSNSKFLKKLWGSV